MTIPPNTKRDEHDLLTREQAAVRLDAVRARIASACSTAGRAPEDVRLVAVSKGHGTHAIRLFHGLGVRDFGESYVQEWVRKRDALTDLTDLRWHFIGHVQGNKARFLAGKVSLVQSVDSRKLAERLGAAQAGAAPAGQDAPLPILLQLEVDPHDEAKFGAPPSEWDALCEAVARNPHLEWKGFMGIGPHGVSTAKLNPLYRRFVENARRLWAGHGNASEPVLSLGMSGDLEVAIASGSTQVRIGTGLFGPRPAREVE